jgi:hypothetical protein
MSILVFKASLQLAKATPPFSALSALPDPEGVFLFYQKRRVASASLLKSLLLRLFLAHLRVFCAVPN